MKDAEIDYSDIPPLQKSRSDPHHVIGSGQREARNFPGNGREAIEGIWWSAESWLVQQAQYDLAHVAADRIKLKWLELASSENL